MPTHATSPSRDARRQAILELVQRQTVRNQTELQELLDEQGFPANQGTISRDLRDLGMVKGPQGYELPPDPTLPPENAGNSLWHAVQEWLVSATPAQNQVVIRTPPGGAQALALAMDRAELPPCLGTLAGDDTILAICATPNKARGLARKLNTLKGGGQ